MPRARYCCIILKVVQRRVSSGVGRRREIAPWEDVTWRSGVPMDDSSRTMDDSPRGPLQTAWAREVQRRHMRAAIRRNGHIAALSNWRAFERTLQPAQPRFANFAPYGFAIGEVPEEITADLQAFFESTASSGTTLPHVASLTDCDFKRLPNVHAGDIKGLDECIICLKPLPAHATLKRLPACGHAFHGPCLRRWLQRSRSCPCCRAEVVLISSRAASDSVLPPTPRRRASNSSSGSEPGAANPSPSPQSLPSQPPSSQSSSAAATAASPPTRGAHTPSQRTVGASAAAAAVARSYGRRGLVPSCNSCSNGRDLAATATASVAGRPVIRTADGGVVVRHYSQLPSGAIRPRQVPADAELTVVRYPSGTARVWRPRAL